MKRAIFFGATTLALVSLVGCGGGGSTADPTPTPAPTASPTPGPSGGGSRIVYWSEEGGNSDLYSANADGTGKTRLTNDAATNESSPNISPDGKKIVYLSAPKANNAKTSVKIMNLDGSGQLTITGDETQKQYPRFSPDGKKIVFQGLADGRYAIFVMNVDGSGLTRLSTDAKKDYFYPNFSPNGAKIAFAKDDNIWVMNADGTGEAKLVDGGDFSYLSPKTRPFWSPDGKKVLYTQLPGPGGAFSASEVYTADADGTGRKKVTSGSGLGWSPDGSKILVYRPKNPLNVTGSSKLVTVNPDGSGETELSLSVISASW